MPLPDMMVDIETSGLSPDFNWIFQIAAVEFNYDTGEVGRVFDRCLLPVPFRGWDEGTRNWWSNMPDVFDDISRRAEDPRKVMEDFAEFAGHAPRFWAKPAHFDFPFVGSYFRLFGIDTPFDFRMVRDVNTHISALQGHANKVKMEHIPFVGNEHNALDDAIYQLTQLLSAKAGVWS